MAVPPDAVPARRLMQKSNFDRQHKAFRAVRFSWLLHTNTSGIPKAAHNF
jgi:hypothetical protein